MNVNLQINYYKNIFFRAAHSNPKFARSVRKFKSVEGKV